MRGLMAYLQRAAVGKRVLILFVLTNLIYALMLGYSIPLVLGYAPQAVLFDMSPAGYSHAQAMELLTRLGDAGRDRYLWVQLPIDFVYPAMFALAYSLLQIWVMKQYLLPQSRWFLLALLPILAGVFDYLENISVIAMLSDFPDLSTASVTIASTFTVAKSALTTVSFVVLLVSLVPLARRRFIRVKG